MTQTVSLTREQVTQFVHDWYRALCDHVPAEQLLTMLAADGLEMRMPEITLRSHEAVRTWYETTIVNRYFDESEDLQSLDISVNGAHADVHLVTRWQARQWSPPAPHSDRIDYTATQSWVVECSPGAARPVIKKYVVEKFVPNEGSIQL